MMFGLLTFYDKSQESLDKGISIENILNLPIREDLSRLKEVPNELFNDRLDSFLSKLSLALEAE
jgi:V/A-type H+-transporting ATPase subunit A